MKKLLLVLSIITLILTLVCVFASCDDNKSDTSSTLDSPANDDDTPNTPDSPANDSETIYQNACILIESEKYDEAYSLLLTITDYPKAKEELSHFFYAPSTRVLSELIYPQGGSPYAETITTKYEYDAQGNVTKIIDEQDNTYYFSYDKNGNLLSGYTLEYIDGRIGRKIINTYENGVLVKSTDENGKETFYHYNAKGDISKKIINGSEITYNYTYHSNNSIKTAIHTDNGITYEYTYDNYGTLSTTKLSWGSGYMLYQMVYENDKLIKIDVTFDAHGDLITGSFTYQHDANGKLIQMQTDKDLCDHHTYSFHDYKLCYSKNQPSNDLLSRITMTHIELIMEYND